MKKIEIKQIQFLRFLAFLMIFNYHCFYKEINGANCAVSFFFILSGMLTGFGANYKENKLDLKAFIMEWFKKIKRFYPLYIVTTLISVSYSKIPYYLSRENIVPFKAELKQFFINMFLVQSWFSKGSFTFNGVGWFLSTILFLYLFNMPIKYVLTEISKTKFKKILNLLFLLVTAICTVGYCYLFRNEHIRFYIYVFPVARLGEYILGLIVGFSMYSIKKRCESLVNRYFDFIVFTLFEILALACWFLLIYNIECENWISTTLLWIIPNIFLISVFILGKGGLSRLFERKIFNFLGNISFELFLIHSNVIDIYVRISNSSYSSKSGKVFMFIFCLMFSILFSVFAKRIETVKKGNIKYEKQ